MKTFATKQKRSAPAVHKGPYVHHPMGPVQLAQQAAMGKILQPGELQTEPDVGELDGKYEQELRRLLADLPVMTISSIPPRGPGGTPPIQRSENQEPEEELQRQPEEEEEEPIRAKLIRRQTDSEEAEEPEAMLQRQAEEEEEEPTQTNLIQRQPDNEEEEEPIQTERIQRKMTDMCGVQSSVFGYVGPDVKAQQAKIHRILRSTGAQTKLTIGQPNDKYEQEANRIADQVMAVPGPKLQRQPENDEEEGTLQTKPLADQITPLVRRQEERPEEEEETPQAKPKSGEDSAVTPSLESRINNLKGGGQPLDPTTRAFFEPRFNRDFSRVRVHQGGHAAQVSNTINARAFTLGNSLVFAAGQYQPKSRAGKRLLAHELTHVVQQSGGQTRRNENQGDQISRAPEKEIQRAIQNVQQDELSTFFSQPESALPQPLLDKYLAEPALMTTQRNVIRELAGRVQRRKAPLTADGLLTLV